MRASCSSEHGACPRASSRSGLRRAAHGRRRCAAGAIALRARGESAAAAVLLGRGQTPFGEKPPLPPGSAAVLDWGIRPFERTGVLVDHHAPEAQPAEDQVVLSGFGERPETSTAPLVRRLLPDEPAWIAAVGAFGDLGDAAFSLPECAGVRPGPIKRLVPHAMHSPSWSRARLPRRPSTIRGPRCSTKRDTRGDPSSSACAERPRASGPTSR